MPAMRIETRIAIQEIPSILRDGFCGRRIKRHRPRMQTVEGGVSCYSFRGHHFTVFFTESEGVYGGTHAVEPRVQAGGEAGDGAERDPGTGRAGLWGARDCAPRMGPRTPRRSDARLPGTRRADERGSEADAAATRGGAAQIGARHPKEVAAYFATESK